MPLTNRVETEEVLDLCPSGEIFARDFYLTDAETWAEKAWGFQRGLVTNVDHHAPVARMRQHLSSTNLALLRVRQEGVVAAGSHIVLNHTDCDSVLSAAVLSGAVEPSDELGVAAIAADHTGEPNAIADLLQAMDALLVPSPLDLWASVGIREVIGQVSADRQSMPAAHKAGKGSSRYSVRLRDSALSGRLAPTHCLPSSGHLWTDRSRSGCSS